MLRLVLTTALVLGPSVPVVAGPMTPSTLFTSVRDTVLMVQASSSDGVLNVSATAIGLGDGRFVTLCSPFDGSDVIRLVDGKGRMTTAVISARDSRRNLCMLSAEGGNAETVGLVHADAVPAVGARVYAVANALDFGIGLTEGVISGVGRGERGELLQFSAPVSPGSEGGALVDEEGRLLGIIDYRQRDGQNLNFALPAAWIGEIEARNDTDVARQALRDQAPRLAREGNAARLGRLAGDWTRAHPEDADGWMWLAVASGLRGNHAAEEAAWRLAERIEPGMPLIAAGIAGALLKQQRFGDARDAARALLVKEAENAAVWALLGQSYQGLGEAGEAEEAYRKAISIDPWQMSAHQGLIALAGQRGDHTAVIAGWGSLVQLHPSQAWLRWRLVEALLMAQEGARAHALLARLPDELASSGDGLFWQGATAALLGRPQEASERFRASLEQEPSEPWRVWGELGKAYFAMDLFPEAIAALREAVRIAPGSADYRYWLAVALKDGGHVHEAMEIDRQLVAAYPDSVNAWRQLGYASVLAGRMQDGIVALERSLALDPRQPRAWNALMMLYRAAGRDADVRRAHTHLRGLDAEMAERAYFGMIRPYEVSPQ